MVLQRAHHAKPIEKCPNSPISRDLPAVLGGRPYHVHDRLPSGVPDQEDWYTVAKKFHVDVTYLIYFNFLTDDSAEVNWYLRHYVGCVKVSPSGNNWMFSNEARPGIIYIPPPDTLDISGEDVCVWGPDSQTKLLKKLHAVSLTKPQRAQRLVNVIVSAGYPDCLNLWYYNGMVVEVYVDWRTNNAKRREMTKDTNGAFPFDGNSGIYSQLGWWEINRGRWRVHPMKAVFDDACRAWDHSALDDFLSWFDADIARGWDAMRAAQGKMITRMGTVFGPMVEPFIESVRRLSLDPGNLYSAFPPRSN
jgi:hypothetical protein